MSYTGSGFDARTRNLLVAESAAADPAPPTGAYMRYRANDLAGGNGAAVAVWPDQASGFDVLQVVGALQPTILANAINGKKALSFDGVLKNFTYPGPTFPTFAAADAFSFCVVAIPGGAANGNALTLNGATTWTIFYAPGGNQFGIFANGSSDFTAAVFASGVATAVTATRAAGGLVAASWFKSVTPIGSTGQALSSIDTAPTTDLLGAYAGPSSLFTGSIAEIIFYKRVLSAAELTQLGTYLTSFYGL